MFIGPAQGEVVYYRANFETEVRRGQINDCDCY